VRRGGRPSKADAEQIGQRIIDAATELFFTLATAPRASRRSRDEPGFRSGRSITAFANKSALLTAVVHRTIDRMRPPADVPLLDGADLAGDPAWPRGSHPARRPVSAGDRAESLIVAESSRFPDLATVVTNQGAIEEAVRLIAGVLEREARAGYLSVDDPTFAAQQFLYMVITVPPAPRHGPAYP